MLELSYSNGAMFKGCQKKFYWRYIKHFLPITKSYALSLGSIIHDGFDLFYKGGSDQEVYTYIAERFDEEMKKEEVSDIEDLLINKYIALGMWWFYPYKNLKEFQHIYSEEEFSVEITPDVHFVGKVDGRIQQQDNWWVRELKTTSMNTRQFEGRCQTSGQGTGYVFGMNKKGYQVKGIMYECIKKPLLRKGVAETADEFGKRIMNDYKSRPKFYYTRYYTYRTPVDLTNFQEDTTLLAEDIQEKLKSGNFYRNTDQCWNFGSECPYAKICFAEEPDPLTLELYFKIGGEKHD